ncbi:hypothetical protein LCGC14_0799040 [marine sediment metagenome]|uniref:SPOR domain-containing protein n=1 Tax=marine sediment metagenome TaxID=412755 RepID=A0A0F9SA89_9ZZZZ
MYFWVLGYSDEGKRVLLGPYASEEKAAEAADFLEETIIYPLETRNQQKASRQVKAELLQDGESSGEAMQRQLHHKGLVQEHSQDVNIPTVLAQGGDSIFSGDPFED